MKAFICVSKLNHLYLVARSITSDSLAYNTELSTKVRVLSFFGLEAAFVPTFGETQENFVEGQFRLSIALQIVPTKPEAFYLKAGVGGADIVKMMDLMHPDTTYHAGAGFDIHFNKNFVMGAEFLLITRGYTAWNTTAQALPRHGEMRRSFR